MTSNCLSVIVRVWEFEVMLMFLPNVLTEKLGEDWSLVLAVMFRFITYS